MREGLLRIVDILTGTVVGRVARGTPNAEPTTHEARTAIKKLRALLRLIRPAVSQQSFETEDKRLKGAAARLVFARDAEVSREGGAIHGALQPGALSTTFTASQGYCS